MSRIGKLPVEIPKGVTIDLSPTRATVKGPKGSLEMPLTSHVNVRKDGEAVFVEPAGNSRQARMMYGTTQRLLTNMVLGVTEGFTKTLEIVGTGYRAEMKGKTLVMRLGYSHEIEYATPAGMEFKTPTQTTIEVFGPNKQQVGQVAAEIRSFRPPEPYKGKGVRYQGEWIRRKAGKAAKK